MKTIISTTAALLLSGTAAAAPAQWDGFYLGAQASHSEGGSHDRGNADASENSIRGFTGGVQGGRYWQFDNNVVTGVEGALSFGNIEREWKDRDVNRYSPYHGKDSVSRSGSIHGTLGYAMGRWLPYVGAGVTVAQQEFTLGCDKSLVEKTNGCRVAEFEHRASHTTVGTHAVAGVQYRFNDRLSAGAEYRYTHLGSSPVTLEDPNYPGAARRNFHTDYSSVTLKLNYYF
ncbi:outer membrane protein [Stenotrophomonas cyclobalanopsidis]|nr:outer membrane beta-barrel protein [Stenotrophomonas cyclobalanopsidis]